MQSGATPYYDIVVTAYGSSTVAARSLRNKNEAEWLAAKIALALGIAEQDREDSHLSVDQRPRPNSTTLPGDMSV